MISIRLPQGNGFGEDMLKAHALHSVAPRFKIHALREFIDLIPSTSGLVRLYGIHSFTVAGEIGSGKSSVVNLLVREAAAKVSPGAGPCTLRTVRHETTIQVQETWTTVHIREVVGFNQPEETTGKHSGAALDMDLDSIHQAKATVDVVLFCIRGSRLKNAPTRIIESVNNLLRRYVTVVPVINCLEREKNMEGGGTGTGNELKHGLRDKALQSRTSLVAILERRYLSLQDSVTLESILGEHIAQNGGSESNEKITQRKDSSWWRIIWPFRGGNCEERERAT
ncbi:hypothetical protein EDD16DRAFT_1793010 [Pisolithus croceorrhizus]|nr:hypothetical protein EV401DRAFT_2201290 [Pisolithus croceorrhizus]KAI6131149.1 hypothetical protein EDD16DRAFT_1793010 [Pisolithus croceorrhizus]KAI6159887.1 hypothetical protein EDD17DRAFT_1510989 [Pisolithus thermaeus]